MALTFSRMLALVAVILVVVSSTSAAKSYRPVVLMHGLGSSASYMDSLASWIRNDFPGIYVRSAEVGDGPLDSYIIEVNKQVEMLAAELASDPNLQHGFDLIGHSQGGLLTRGYIERFNNPPVHNWISLAGPHAGVFGVPKFNSQCPDADCPWLAELMSYLAEVGLAEAITQQYLSFAQYWKNPLNYSLYLNTSGYLADVNNERPVKNGNYKANMISLNHAALVLAELDDIVIPKESAFFEFYELGQDSVVQNFTDTPTYIGDWVGLRTLQNSGRLSRHRVNCSHSGLPSQGCKDVVYPIVKPLVGGVLA